MLEGKNKKLIRIAFWVLLAGFFCVAMNPFSDNAGIVRSSYGMTYNGSVGMADFTDSLFEVRPFHFIVAYFPYNISGFVRLLLSKAVIGLVIGVFLRMSYDKKALFFMVPFIFAIVEFLQPLFLVGFFDIDSILFYVLGYVLGIAACSIASKRFTPSYVPQH